MTRALLIGVLLSSSICAQGIITTLAGTDWIFPGDGKPAKDAPLGVQSMGVALDQQGNLFIADQLNHMVLKVSADGILTIVAGNGVPGFAGENGPARSASLNRPSDLIALPDGTLYVADTGNSRIRKITPDGIISVIAGTNRAQFAGDGGPATSASLNNPGGIALDANGALYIADGGNLRVRKISADGIMSTVAGNGQEGFSGDGGSALDATFFFLTGVALDGSGNLYITDRSNHRIRKVTADGVIATVAGDGRAILAGDNGPAITASLRSPTRLAFDTSGNLFVTDTGNGRVRKISPSGTITTAIALSLPDGVAVDSSGNLFVTQRGGLVALVSPGGPATTYAGNGAFRAFPEGSLAANAFLFGPIGTFLDAAGNLFVADSTNARVRRITPDGRIFTVAGTGVPACGTDGRAALSTGLGSPSAMAMDQAGRLHFSDATCGNVRRLGADGTLTIVAGGGVGLLDTARPANLTSLDSPQGITFDRAGNLLIVETGAQRIRRVTPGGTISTIAGNGQRGFSGDNGPATNASFNDPSGIAVDSADNLYIADRRNNRVRRITPDGRISTYAGNARGAFAGDGGPATSASLAAPHRVTFDAGGNLYIADEGNHRIRLVTPNGVISTIAGNGTAGFSGDGGLATDASLRTPKDVAIAADGTLYIADLGNDRIRVISKLAPRILASASTLSFSAKSGGPVSQAATIGLSSSVAGVPFSIGIATSSGGSWLRANPASGTIPATAEISADPSGLAPGTYRGTVNINAPSALPAVLAVSVTLVVEPGEPARLGAELRSLSFSFTRQSGSASSQVVISNRGSGVLNFASSTTTAGGAWLSVSPASGTATATAAATLTVTANPAGWNPGTFGGRVAIRSTTTNEVLDLPVTMTISAIQQSILLSQTGLAFTAVAGGGVVLPQTFGIVNTGQGVMSWSVRASTLSGGSNWLSVRPTSGSTNALSLNVPLVEVGVDASRLAPGEYYGQVDVIAPGADNSPQNASVVLNVLPPGSNPGPVVRPTGLIFTGVADGDSPGSQDVLVSNLTSGPTNYTSGRLTSDGQSWFVHVPGSATVTPDQPGRIVVQADLAGLTGGIRRGVLTLLFQDGTARTVNLLLVLVRSRGLSAKPAHLAEGCTPTALLPVFTSLGTDFSVPGGWPVPVEARVVDDCGDPLTSGSVVATFSNGDVPLALVPLRDGRWSGTWQARNSTTAQVTISLAAQNPAQSVKGNAQLTGGLRANLNPPQVLPGGVVSAASLAAGAPLAPGSVVSIFGSRLSDSRLQATQLPLDTQLAGSLVTIAGRALPLLFASDGQINAMLPYDIPVNVRHQIAVRRGSSLTVPEPVTVAEAQPAIFTKDQSGKGQGVIIDVQNRYVEPGNGARAGDAVVIYCSGLGAVDPAVVAGAAAPPAPLSRTVNTVALTIGGVRAEVFFAGLAPGFAGLYQVNAYVPQGAPIGDAVPVVLTVAGQASPAVTMAVR